MGHHLKGKYKLEILFGLVQGRHALPVSEYIFESTIADVHDYKGMREVIASKLGELRFTRDSGFHKAVVYVTGLTPVTVEVIKFCLTNFIPLDLMNYDRESDSYVRQPVVVESQFSGLAYDYGMDGLY